MFYTQSSFIVAFFFEKRSCIGELNKEDQFLPICDLGLLKLFKYFYYDNSHDMQLNLLNQSSKKSLALNIALFLLIQIINSFLVFGLGWDKGDNPSFVQKPYVEPSGALVGGVWLSLYLLMSYSRWYLNRFTDQQIKKLKSAITILLIWCSLYPFYTFAIDSAYGGLVGNAGIFSLSLFIIISSWKKVRSISYLILPVLLWITFATTIILSELGYF